MARKSDTPDESGGGRLTHKLSVIIPLELWDLIKIAAHHNRCDPSDVIRNILWAHVEDALPEGEGPLARRGGPGAYEVVLPSDLEPLARAIAEKLGTDVAHVLIRSFDAHVEELAAEVQRLSQGRAARLDSLRGPRNAS